MEPHFNTAGYIFFAIHSEKLWLVGQATYRFSITPVKHSLEIFRLAQFRKPMPFCKVQQGELFKSIPTMKYFIHNSAFRRCCPMELSLAIPISQYVRRSKQHAG